jgi:hypothetical protein
METEIFEVNQKGWALYITTAERDCLLAAGMIRESGDEENGDYTLTDSATWEGIDAMCESMGPYEHWLENK